jgi:squalene-associated FAD-dependent desaturase
MTTHPDVLVIGAGFAGLACATALTEAGARVEVLEASGAPGGRAGSFRETSTGEMLDLGQHVLVGANRDALTLLRRLGSERFVQFQSSLAIEYVWSAGRRRRLACPPLPAPLHLAAALLGFSALPLNQRVSALTVGQAARHLGRRRSSATTANGLTPGPLETVREWLTRLRQGPEAMRLLWEPLAVAILNDAPERSSAALLARVLAEAFCGGRAACGMGWARRPLRDLVEPAGLWLAARGGRLSCSTPAERLRFDGARVDSVLLRGGGERRAGAYVSALPARSLLHLLQGAPAPLRPLEELARRFAPRSTPILSVYLWSERPFLDAPFCALPEGPFPWLFQRRLRDSTHEHPRGTWVATLVLSGARGWMERTDADILEAARRQIEETFTGGAARLRHARVVRQPAATFEPAPDLCAIRPGARTASPNLFLAGDWTDTGLPSTLEGAARSGHTAARCLLQEAGRGDGGRAAADLHGGVS